MIRSERLRRQSQASRSFHLSMPIHKYFARKLDALSLYLGGAFRPIRYRGSCHLILGSRIQMLVYQQIRNHYIVLRRNASERCIDIPMFRKFYPDRHSSQFSSVNLNASMLGAVTALVLGLAG